MQRRIQRWFVCFAALCMAMGQMIAASPKAMAQNGGFGDILIVVDAGHTTGYNTGCISGYYEGDWAYRQTLLDAQAYTEAGFSVITTRGENENPGLVSRGQMAVQNASGYRDVVFISNHSNASPDRSTKASGVSACTSQYLSQDNTDLIEQMMDAVAQVMNASTGVTYVRTIASKPLNASGVDWYGVIRGAVNGATNAQQAAQGPVQYAFILEHGFHTNPAECSFLMSEENCRMLAKAKAIALTRYFGTRYGIPYTDEELPTAAAPETSQEAAPEFSSAVTESSTESETTGSTAPAQTTASGEDYSDSPILIRRESGDNYWTAVVSVEDDGLNVRSEANSFVDNVIAKLPNGTSVVVVGEAVSGYGDVWFEVVVSGGVRGFVHGRYLLPRFYTVKNVRPLMEGITVFSLPENGSASLSAYPAISSSDSILTLNEVFCEDGWWSIIKINDCHIGFVPSRLLRER